MHVGRKAVVIAQRSRRGIPLHWNERCQHKHNTDHSNDLTLARRGENKIMRSKVINHMRSFHGEWEDFDPIFVLKVYLD